MLAAGVAACAPEPAEHAAPAAAPTPGAEYTVTDTSLAASIEAAGVAEPFARATLSTKLMGTVTEVLVREGDAVRAGQPLVRIDARDLAAKEAQVGASVAEAEAVHRDARVQAGRIRALHADSAATRAQLDAAETGLARAEAGVRAARAAAAELGAVRDYAVVRAPFAGTVTERFVDPGAFAAPGAPLVAVQDGSRLRISVSVAPEAVRGLRRGQPVDAVVEGTSARATVEGVVPAAGGSLYTVNAIVDNRAGRLLAGGAAWLALPQGVRPAVVVPAAAVRREGDLTGVLVRGPRGDALRWVRLGASAGGMIEVLAGLRAGERVVIPSAATLSTAHGAGR
jgi:RND family efflux transporter MFP subunit